ncbi:aminotransferase GliI [Apiospora kogelbergensis]|uniref:Aminotransferase GliI n=1 Tax=Apiospora kogelbergensis TaxID=1337665 RepID=A0AAW0QGM0_9PEZI
MVQSSTTPPASPRLRDPSSSIIPHVALYVVQVLALASPPSRSRNYVFAALIAGLCLYTQFHPHFSNDPGLVQPFTIAWSYYLDTLSKLLFSGPRGPEAAFWRLDRSRQEAVGYKAFGWKKLRWALSLILNQRGARWNYQVKNVHPVQSKKRAAFLALQAWNFAKCILISDLLFSLSRRLFYTTPDGLVGAVNSHDLTLRHPDWRWSFARALVFGALPYFMLTMQYSLLAFVGVVTGLTRPMDWPPIFGPISEVTTVRSFWGKYWHQQLRRMLTSYTDAFVEWLGIPRGTNWSSYTTLYLAFLISGTFHALSQRQMPRRADVSDGDVVAGFFGFFVWQALAITLEDAVGWCWRGLGLRSTGHERWRRLVGYVWVTCCIWASLPLAGDTFLRMRMGEESFLPFTLFGPWVESLVPIPP